MILPSLSRFFSSFPRYFFLFFIVLFAVVFFTLYESFRVYRAEAELLVISKGAAASSETVAMTIAHLPLTLSFYDRLLSDHKNITDPWEENISIERKTSWNRVIESSALPKTNVVRMAVSSPDSSQAGALLNASLETLYGFSGRLYDRNTEADVRLIDGVLVRPVLIYGWALFLISLFFAAILAFLVSSLFQMPLSSLGRISLPTFPLLRARMFSDSRGAAVTDSLRPVGAFPNISGGDSSSESNPNFSGYPDEPAPFISEPKNQAGEAPVVFEGKITSTLNLKKEESESKQEEGNRAEPEKKGDDEPHDIWEKPRPLPMAAAKIQPAIPDSSVLQTKTSLDSHFSLAPSRGNSVHNGVSAPRNLSTVSAQDFTWEKFLFQNGEVSKEIEHEEAVADIPVVTPPSPEKREPTPEELKARLNQLLRGEM